MKLRRIGSVLGLAGVVALSVGCGARRSPSQPPVGSPAFNEQPCNRNYSEIGSFIGGKTCRTFQEFPGISPGAVFDQLLAYTATMGGQISVANKDLGLISATRSVSYGEGATVALTIMVKPRQEGGTRVDMSTGIGGGQIVLRKGGTRTAFCDILAAVATPVAKTASAKASSPKKPKHSPPQPSGDAPMSPISENPAP
jgi:hypothetical protein